MNYADLGYLRVAAVAPALALADPLTNATRIASHLADLERQSVALAVFPELSLTGYSCEDLFFTSDLHTHTQRALATLAPLVTNIVAVVGVPWRLEDGRLLNCAAVIADGRLQGLVPKTAPPNYGEFYERRWFVPGGNLDLPLDVGGMTRISSRQLFRIGGATFGIEICEDLWAPRPPGIEHALAGAEVIVNLSASNELVAKAEYRRSLVHMASARGICGYLYAGSGALESTKDVVFGGHLLAYEAGQALAESQRFSFEAQTLISEFDLERIRHDRAQNTTYANTERPSGYQVVNLATPVPVLDSLTRAVDPHPFVPADVSQFDARAREILDIQATGLARRQLAADAQTLVIGLSGGLDSTLAFLVCLEAVARLGRSRGSIRALTLPGPGTSEHTKTSAIRLSEAAGVPLLEISISKAVALHLDSLGHTAEDDVVFENVQARERTQLLFNYANKVGGIVVGTGDLSELALGWCTYNADHMANYNVNASVPKTMVAYLVRWYAQHQASTELADVLARVLDTPISPELIAPVDGVISQQTEEIIGPFELHDFFLYQFVRTGAGVKKLFALACLAFEDAYEPAQIAGWLRVFLSRFFRQQFKRTTLPPGPKVGTVSLSPRGDWRMPDEAAVERLLAEVDGLTETPTREKGPLQ
jgi:NAD+ synthase (glutamine-hydrolysing)